jgi:hypothetical protein
VAVKETCLHCGGSWSRNPTEPRHPCTKCGNSEWDREPALDNVGLRNEYRILEERILDNHILALDLQGTSFSHSPSVVLSHRLKNDYRHRKSDLMAGDGRELVIVFDRASSGPKKGLPVVSELKRARQTSVAVAKSAVPTPKDQADVELTRQREARKQKELELKQRREQWRRQKDLAKAVGWVLNRVDREDDEE